MEPAEYRPDDAASFRAVSADAPPQWSRPSIGRMTATPLPAFLGACEPQWSRPSIGRMTNKRCGIQLVKSVPQWSRPSIGRMTRDLRDLVRIVGLAAMEPAEYRPDDLPVNRLDTPRGPPQWSRPSIGRMTIPHDLLSQRSPAPQWSRPSIGRMTERAARC